ncbi:Bax inhibitor-1/YccA family protein [Nocardioides sp. AN3]
MQSNNPVFRNSDGFSKNAYGNATYAGNGQAYAGYGSGSGYSDPSTWGVGTPGAPARTSTGPMTIDSVVQKTAISVGLAVLAAVITWVMTPDVTDPTVNLGSLYAALTIGSLGAFALSWVNSLKRIVSPALVLAFAALEGVALGAFSKVLDAYAGGGIVMPAVLGTFAAFAGTLAVYRFFDIKVGSKFRTMVMAAVLGMVGLSVLTLVLSLFGIDLGIFGFGALGLLMAVVGVALGVFMLVLDFDFVEQGIRNQLDDRESWRAAFAMTVSLVWIYTNLLKILAILRN